MVKSRMAREKQLPHEGLRMRGSGSQWVLGQSHGPLSLRKDTVGIRLARLLLQLGIQSASISHAKHWASNEGLLSSAAGQRKTDFSEFLYLCL